MTHTSVHYCLIVLRYTIKMLHSDGIMNVELDGMSQYVSLTTVHDMSSQK